MDEKLERKIAKLKNGDSSVFDYVYEHTNRPVYFAIFYILKDKMYAEDVLQDTYVRAISSIEQYKDGTNFVGWLCSIGKSLALNHLKNTSAKCPPTSRKSRTSTACEKRSCPTYSTWRQKS